MLWNMFRLRRKILRKSPFFLNVSTVLTAQVITVQLICSINIAVFLVPLSKLFWAKFEVNSWVSFIFLIAKHYYDIVTKLPCNWYQWIRKIIKMKWQSINNLRLLVKIIYKFCYILRSILIVRAKWKIFILHFVISVPDNQIHTSQNDERMITSM